MANTTNSKALSAEELRSSLAACDAASAAKAKGEGRWSARERICAFFDESTFVEIGAYVTRGTDADWEGVICGYGSLDGRLVFAYAQDADRKKGAMDARQGEKIARLYALAVKNGAPVVAMLDSNGADVKEGVPALAAYGKVMKCVSDASGVIPQIAYVPGVCTGTLAVLCEMYDIVLTQKDKSALYVSSPALTDAAVGTSVFTAANGTSALVCENEADALAKLRRLLNLLPSNNCEGNVVCESAEMNAAFEESALQDASAALAALCDGGDVTELYAGYAPEVKVALGPVGGTVSGIVVNNGKLTACAARKIARFVSFCDSFGIPVVTLVNCGGVQISGEAEEAAAAADFAKLAQAYASSTNAKVTVVIGEAYGAGYTLMGSKALGADVVFALDSAKIAPLSPETGVAFLWNNRIADSEKTSAEARADLENEWKATIASPVSAANCGEIDDIIAVAETKQRVCAALQMLANKADGVPSRRHISMPL